MGFTPFVCISYKYILLIFCLAPEKWNKEAFISKIFLKRPDHFSFYFEDNEFQLILIKFNMIIFVSFYEEYPKVTELDGPVLNVMHMFQRLASRVTF